MLSHLVCKLSSGKTISSFKIRKQAQRGSGELEFNPGLSAVQFPKFSHFCLRVIWAPSFWNTFRPLFTWLAAIHRRLWLRSLLVPVNFVALCISPFQACMAFSCVCLLWTTGRKELCLIHSCTSAARNQHTVGTQTNLSNQQI